MGQYVAAVEDHLIFPARVRVTAGREPFFRASGQSVPVPVEIRLLIDTGSKRTTLIPGIVRHLQPSWSTEARLVTSVGSVATDLFWVCLEFPEAGLVPFPEILVARHPMLPVLSQFHGLLGRDVLRRLESFEYLGRRGHYRLRDTPGWLGWLRRWL
jgi:hypothetical protein